MSALSSLKQASAKKTTAEELKEEPKKAAATKTVGKAATAKAAPKKEEPKPEPVAEEATAEQEVEVDLDAMTAAELDALVKQYEIETPKEWKKWKKEQKAAWLQEQFASSEGEGEGTSDENGDAPDEAEAEQAETTAEPEVAVPEEPKAKAVAKTAGKKTVGSGKAVATSNVKHGEVLSPDDFSNTIAEIENLKQKDALELVDKLSDASDFTLFKLGGVLSRIHEDGWYKEQGFANFRDYIENRHSLGYRKAMYWVAIYKDIVSSGVPYSAVATVKWSKLKEIAGVINPDNVEHWVKTAHENTVDNLIKLVKAYSKDGSGDVQAQLSSPEEGLITTMAFKVHTDQKENIQAALDKAKAEAGTEVNTVALEFICIAFNSGATGKGKKPAKQLSAKEQLAGMELEAAAQALLDAFPDVNLEITVKEAEDA